MKNIKIDNNEIYNEIKTALEQMVNHEWTGWKIDILVAPDTGSVWSSEINTNSVYTNSMPLLRVERWEYNEEDWAELSDAIYEEANNLLTSFESGDFGFKEEVEREGFEFFNSAF